MNYTKHLLISISTVSGCDSIGGGPIGITSSTIVLKTFVITAGIKKSKSIINKKKNKHHKILSLATSKFNSAEVLILGL